MKEKEGPHKQMNKQHHVDDCWAVFGELDPSPIRIMPKGTWILGYISLACKRDIPHWISSNFQHYSSLLLTCPTMSSPSPICDPCPVGIISTLAPCLLGHGVNQRECYCLGTSIGD